MYRFYRIVCPNCKTITRVEYAITDSFEWSGRLHVSNRELYHYYDNDSYNAGIAKQDPHFQGDWSWVFTCHECGQDIDELDYIKAFVAYNQEDTIVDISDLNKSFRPFLADCTPCNVYSEVITHCYMTVREDGYLCIDEHNKVAFVRMWAEEDAKYISYYHSCCDEEIDEGRLRQLRIDDGIRHSVEIVDIFADFWPPPESDEIEDRFEILDFSQRSTLTSE
jgi:hypothetical protein